jgi:site-specific DNA-methyltransferase (adenine-specific)
MMARIERLSDDVTLYLGDCREILPTLGKVDAVVTDPPYGILNLDGETSAIRKSPRQQGSGKLKNRVLNQADVNWDIVPARELFDLLRSMSGHQTFWGGNYFPLPPTRGILVWDKEQPWPNFSQAEIAWTPTDRPAAVFRLNSGRGCPDRSHPTQKPLELMAWCIERIPPPATLILDPFMGSGTTGVAAVKLGRKFVGIEIEPKYFDIARRRIADELARPQLFKAEPLPPPEQLSLMSVPVVASASQSIPTRTEQHRDGE